MIRIITLWALLLMVATVLAGCGGTGATFMQTTERYAVTLTLDTLAVGDRGVTVELRDRSGAAIDGAQVTLVPTMLSMGMASPEVAAQPNGAGSYRADAVLLSMTGDWELDVRVEADGATETARFLFTVPTE